MCVDFLVENARIYGILAFIHGDSTPVLQESDTTLSNLHYGGFAFCRDEKCKFNLNGPSINVELGMNIW